MRYTHPDQDLEVVEPLVPEMDGETDQTVEGRPPETNSSRLPLSQSVSDEVPYFTWDIEQIEPVVPIMASGGTELE